MKKLITITILIGLTIAIFAYAEPNSLTNEKIVKIDDNVVEITVSYRLDKRDIQSSIDEVEARKAAEIEKINVK